MQGRGTREGQRRLQYERASRDLQPSLPDFQAVAFVGTMAGQMLRRASWGTGFRPGRTGSLRRHLRSSPSGWAAISIRARVIDQVVLSVVLPVSMLALA
ncbi:manganese transporter [Burkholderia cenocepacia]|uniref:manganese transporter n=1 Tax=Burkholderia cenocepacia TaxID=95486 RepID=UPI0021AB4647|nr:manganese transporter [Burkholderia cenocepacia]